MCAGHVPVLTGESPVEGIYRQAYEQPFFCFRIVSISRGAGQHKFAFESGGQTTAADRIRVCLILDGAFHPVHRQNDLQTRWFFPRNLGLSFERFARKYERNAIEPTISRCYNIN